MLSVLFGVLVLLVIVIYTVTVGFTTTIQDPGVAFKVMYADHPELQIIYEEFKKTCVIPSIPQEYLNNLSENHVFQNMRKELFSLPDTTKYSDYELDNLDIPELKEFYDDKKYTIGDGKEYQVRLGCLRRTINLDMENIIKTNIQALMSRYGLNNELQKESDSRGATLMVPNSMMEWHSNQNHFGGYRLYFHYLVGEGDSHFVYRHPYDFSYRTIQDIHEGGNLFRIRKPPKPLLWHGIFTNNVYRFSLGIWLPLEVGRVLKSGAICV